jgi:predicted acetyltransferase
VAEKYEIRRFRAAAKGGPGYHLGTEWLRGVGLGFYDDRHKEEFTDKVLAMNRVDNRELTGVYQCGAVAAHSLSADVPVATFATFRKELNIGYGRQLPAHMVTSVTVRGTHRRQGLLRRMMTEDLTAARADGMALAALTASEASIYGRFGYGVATFERSIQVDTGPKFQLRRGATGRVEIADPKVLLDLAPEVFARVHRNTPGSLGRQEAYRQRVSGAWSRDGTDDGGVKCALHYDADGTVDGYVSYKFAGWEAKPPTVKIVDLLAATDAAYLELWQFLGSIDIVERVSWEEAPVDDPLAWALEDPRCIESSDHRDMLWLRILDT